MVEKFSGRARKVMELANKEALRFGHDSIDTEHVLLGLLEEGSGVGANVLNQMAVDLRKVRLEAQRRMKSNPDLVVVGKLPMTSAVRRVVENAVREARELQHSYVGTEHLLLGLLSVPDCVAAQVLGALGLTLTKVRQETLHLLEDGPAALSSILDVQQVVAAWPVGTQASMPTDAPDVRKAVGWLILSAFCDRASDIELDPDGVRVRIDGVLQARAATEGVTTQAMIDRFKMMAGMDLGERQSRQDGRIQLRVNEESAELRVTAGPTAGGNRMAVRILRGAGQ